MCPHRESEIHESQTCKILAFGVNIVVFSPFFQITQSTENKYRPCLVITLKPHLFIPLHACSFLSTTIMIRYARNRVFYNLFFFFASLSLFNHHSDITFFRISRIRREEGTSKDRHLEIEIFRSRDDRCHVTT